MPRKKKASANLASAGMARNPVTTKNLMGINVGDGQFRGGIKRPVVTTGAPDDIKGRAARVASGAGGAGVGGQRWRQAAAGEKTAGMLIDNVQTSRAFLSGYALEAYRTSFANGLNNRSGTYDVPGYFVQMNQLNGGILYWPVTLQEKYQWFRYFARCIYLSSKDLGLVTMADGTTKDIRDVQIGDEVITGLGTVRKVKDKFVRRFADDNATTIKAWCIQNHLKTTHHHPYWILRQEKLRYANGGRFKNGIKFEPEWVHAEDIHPGDYVLLPPLPSSHAGVLNTDAARLLGYYAAEGSLIKEKRCVGTGKNGKGYKWGQDKKIIPVGVSFSLNVSEETTLAKAIIDAVKAVFGRKARVARRRGQTMEVVVNGRDVAEFCLKHCGEYSDRKQLSSDVLMASTDVRRAFLMAYAEGDGHQYDESTSNKGKIVIGTSSSNLASQVQMLAISCGIMCRHASYDRPEGGFESSSKQIHISIPSWSANELVDGVFSERWDKIETSEDSHCAFMINGYAAFKVKEVTHTQEDDLVYNLEVDAKGDEKSFICNGMVTHNTDPYIGRALDLLADLPMSKLTLNMPKMAGKEKLRQEILEFFQYQVEKIGLFEICQNILWESNCIGNCFLFHEYNEKTMMWERVIMLPPEEVYVFQYPFSDNKRVEYRPERLMALIKSDGKEMVMGQAGLSEDIVDHIPAELIDMVRREGCIVMDSDPMTGSFVAHIARRKHPYMDLGASILERVLVPLLQKENYRYTQLSLANRNMTPKNLITAQGLLQEELDNLRAQVDLSYLDPDYSIITNYEVGWQQIGAQDRILNLDSEYERIENQCFAAMGVTRELLTGEGSYSGNKITVEILNTMFLLTRETLKNYIEKQLFLPLAERHGWFEVGAFGIKKYWYPQVGFNRLTIRDNNEVFESLFQLYQKGSLNVDIIYELFNLNGDQIREKLLEEVFTVMDPTFNRLLEEVHAEVGRNLSTTTDVLERITKPLGLKITNPPNVPQAGAEGGAPGAPGGFGGGFGEEAPAATEDDTVQVPVEDTADTGTPAAEGAQGVQSGPTLQDIGDAVAESVPAGTTPEEIGQIVDGLQTRRVRKLPTLQDVANSVAEGLPQGASEDDIGEIVDKVTK